MFVTKLKYDAAQTEIRRLSTDLRVAEIDFNNVHRAHDNSHRAACQQAKRADEYKEKAEGYAHQLTTERFEHDKLASRLRSQLAVVRINQTQAHSELLDLGYTIRIDAVGKATYERGHTATEVLAQKRAAEANREILKQLYYPYLYGALSPTRIISSTPSPLPQSFFDSVYRETRKRDVKFFYDIEAWPLAQWDMKRAKDVYSDLSAMIQKLEAQHPGAKAMDSLAKRLIEAGKATPAPSLDDAPITRSVGAVYTTIQYVKDPKYGADYRVCMQLGGGELSRHKTRDAALTRARHYERVLGLAFPKPISSQPNARSWQNIPKTAHPVPRTVVGRSAYPAAALDQIKREDVAMPRRDYGSTLPKFRTDYISGNIKTNGCGTGWYVVHSHNGAVVDGPFTAKYVGQACKLREEHGLGSEFANRHIRQMIRCSYQ